jgi:hypothetical protein
MQPADSSAPIIEVYVEERKVATLHEPQRVEMFWCSYRSPFPRKLTKFYITRPHGPK